MARFASGVKGLDELIGGGYVPHVGVALIGPVGVGKSIISRQFIWNGLENGDHCLIITYDHPREDIQRSMLDCGMDIAPYLENKQLKIVDYFTITINPNKFENTLTPPEYTGKGLIEVIKRYEAEMSEAVSNKVRFRVVVDSVSPFLSLTKMIDFYRLAQTMSSYVRKYEGVGIVTLHQGAQQKIFQVLTTQFTENVIELTRRINDGEMEYRLRISKFLDVTHSKKFHKYVLTEKGIEIVA